MQFVYNMYIKFVNLITRGQNTNNISEAGVKIMKDVVLDRTKAYSPVQLFFFIVQDLDTFYKMKILDLAANRPPQYLKKRFLITKIQQKSLKYEAIQLSDSLYLIHNTLKNTTYNIDLDTGLCSCPQGNTGKSCKHQIFVAKDLKRELGLCLLVTEEIRNKLHVIATDVQRFKMDGIAPLLIKLQLTSLLMYNMITLKLKKKMIKSYKVI